MPTSVLRRYTPPTCTLEVAANRSALSRWADKTVMRDVQFQLTVTDPDTPTQAVVKLTGDRTQLEGLSEAIQGYVQSLLEMNNDPHNPMLRHLVPNGQGAAVEIGSSQSTANNLVAFPKAQRFSTETGIYLETKGLLAHDLHLGTLASEGSGPVVRLSTLQLFDLANALEEYAAESLAMPGKERSPAGIGRWAGIAAMALLAVGVTGGIAKFVMDIGAPTTVAVEDEANQAEIEPEAATDFGIVEATPTNPQPTPVQPPPPNAPPGSGLPFPSGSLFGSNNVPQQTAPPTDQQFANIPPQQQSRQVPPPPTGQPMVPPAPTGADGSGLSVTQAPSLPSPGGAAPDSLNEAAIAETPTVASAPLSTHRSLGMPSPGDLSQQLNEIQAYFQDSWEPPDALNDTLEYRVLLGPEGRVEQIVPMGDAAGLYLDRTGMPLLGDQFVSPLQPYEQALVRVVLAPDGRVQTFLEGRN